MHARQLPALSVGIAAALSAAVAAASPINIIFDSDMGPDIDDAGALAMLHYYANEGRANILATISCNAAPNTARATDIINTYYGRPDIPIAFPTSGAPNGAGWSTSVVNQFPNLYDFNTATTATPTSLYRQTLAAQPDNSVTLVTIGWLTNLSSLLNSGPDAHSPLSGLELIQSKVKSVVSMAGRLPGPGDEYNIYMDTTAADNVLKNLKGVPVIFSPWELGAQMMTGSRLMKEGAADNPVRAGYLAFHNNNQDGLRQSWDQTAVMYAVEGLGSHFNMVTGGYAAIDNRTTRWLTTDIPDGLQHSYLTARLPGYTAAYIDALMLHVEPTAMPTPPSYSNARLTLKFDQNGGATVNDLSGQHQPQPLTLTNFPTTAANGGEGGGAGWIEGALRFDDRNGGAGIRPYIQTTIDLNDSGEGLLTNSFMLAARVSHDEPAQTWSPIFGQSSPTTGTGAANIFFFGKQAGSDALHVRIGAFTIGNIETAFTGGTIADGELHDVALIYNADEKHLWVLFDGEIVAFAADFTPVIGDPGMLRIGNVGHSASEVWDGKVESITVAVPEPAAAGALALGCFGMLCRRSRSR